MTGRCGENGQFLIFIKIERKLKTICLFPIPRPHRKKGKSIEFIGKTSISGKKKQITLSKRSDYKAVKKYSKKLQITLANGKIKWYSIYKPVMALLASAFSVEKRDYKFFDL